MYTCRSVQIKFCYQNNLTHTQTMYYLIGPRKSCKFTFLRNVPHEIGLSFSNLCFPLLFLCSPNSLKKFSISDICSSLFFIPSLFIATLFIYLFIFGCVGSSVRARAFSGYGKRGPLLIAARGPLFIAVRGPFTTAAPPVAGHRLQTRRLSSRGSRAQPLRGTRDPPRPGLEPASPAPAGRLSTTAPPGKPCYHI